MSKSTVNGIFWSGIERFSVQGIQFILTIIIARLVSPADYGLVALLTVFLVMAQVFVDSGFSTALIQKQTPSDTDYSTAFLFSSLVGGLIYIILFFLARPIALFFDTPQLELIAKIVFLNIFINSFSIVHRAILTINLDFKSQSKASLVAVTLSGFCGVYLAYRGYNVWALVFQTLLNNILNVVMLWYIVKWKPKLCFSIDSFKYLFSFGSKLLLAGIISSLYNQIYTVVIGKTFSTVSLGYYNRSSTFASWFSVNISYVFNRAFFPILCSLKSDNAELERKFLVYLRFSCFVIFPLMLGIFVLADPLIITLFTEKWLPLKPLLRILCIAYMWDPVMLLNSSYLAAKGRSDLQLKAEIIKKTVAILILCVTFPFGLEYVCVGLVLYSIADIFIITRFLVQESSITLYKEIKTIMPIALLSLSMALLLYLFLEVYEGSSLIRLITGFILGVVIYVVSAALFSFKECDVLFSYIRKIRSR